MFEFLVVTGGSCLGKLQLGAEPAFEIHGPASSCGPRFMNTERNKFTAQRLVQDWLRLPYIPINGVWFMFVRAKAWADSELQLQKAFISYCTVRCQRNTGARSEIVPLVAHSTALAKPSIDWCWLCLFQNSLSWAPKNDDMGWHKKW